MMLQTALFSWVGEAKKTVSLWTGSIIPKVVIESQADFVVLAGDFNTAPMTEADRTYSKVVKVMADAFQA